MVEGAPLLRAYMGKTRIEGSNPSLSANFPTHVYRILRAPDWREFQSRGTFEGTAIDVRDGFIHLSARKQVATTAAVHFCNEADLIVLEIDTARSGAALRWEPSRDGELFPHFYGVLPLSAVARAVTLEEFANV